MFFLVLSCRHVDKGNPQSAHEYSSRPDREKRRRKRKVPFASISSPSSSSPSFEWLRPSHRLDDHSSHQDRSSETATKKGQGVSTRQSRHPPPNTLRRRPKQKKCTYSGGVVTPTHRKDQPNNSQKRSVEKRAVKQSKSQ